MGPIYIIVIYKMGPTFSPLALSILANRSPMDHGALPYTSLWLDSNSLLCD